MLLVLAKLISWELAFWATVVRFLHWSACLFYLKTKKHLCEWVISCTAHIRIWYEFLSMSWCMCVVLWLCLYISLVRDWQNLHECEIVLIIWDSWKSPFSSFSLLSMCCFYVQISHLRCKHNQLPRQPVCVVCSLVWQLTGLAGKHFAGFGHLSCR